MQHMRTHMTHIQYQCRPPRYAHTRELTCFINYAQILSLMHSLLHIALFIPLSVHSPYMSSIYSLPHPHSFLHCSQLLQQAWVVAAWPVPSIIPRQECIKDSSLQLNLKGKTMTPGIAAELWRPPIKLFAFDLILSFLPPR